MAETKKAAALKYHSDSDRAPKVVAKGKGHVAKAIISRAEENQIPVYEDPKLADQLEKLSLGEEIPPYLYDVVAQVLVFIARLDKTK